ncbi:hypothetical protein N7U66_13365 [Lacinutrix neustonica]|uniref:Peptidase M4 domain-containing protein n=1 Tax=Lacinutrix neustonica TaxID=2980107 RepID=A0A9E8MVQ1_9FLAO|nr:hypothetical protein [Lacinutrix neustonica]WAC01139.1 hypothetical protein N7U66_13365 [Lacinutrix neustonica]
MITYLPCILGIRTTVTGAAINSWVHYDDVAGGLGYDNAFWNGSVMTYGDGSSNGAEGNGYFDALTSIDVAAHEIGHAVTSSTANLAYQRESEDLMKGFLTFGEQQWSISLKEMEMMQHHQQRSG